MPFIEELIEVLVEFDAELYRINSLKKSRGEAGKDGKEGSAGDDVDEGTAEEDPSKDARFGIDIVLLLIKVCLHNDTRYATIYICIVCMHSLMHYLLYFINFVMASHILTHHRTFISC